MAPLSPAPDGVATVFARARLRRVLAVLGGVAWFLAVMPHFSVTTGVTAGPELLDHLRKTLEDMPSTEECRFGWSHSPLCHYRSERTLTFERGVISVSRRGGMTVGLLSWSSLTLAVGIGLFWVARKVRPVTTPAGPGQHRLTGTP